MEHTKDAGAQSIERNVYDRILWTHERDRRRLVIALVIAMLLLAGWAVTETVLRHAEHRDWLKFMGQYDFEEYEYVQDGQGVNIIGDKNGVNYGPAFESAAHAPEAAK